MTQRNSIVTDMSPTLPSTLRRSPRFLQPQNNRPQAPKTPKQIPKNASQKSHFFSPLSSYPNAILKENSQKSIDCNDGSSKSSKSNNGVKGFQVSRRRSPRFSFADKILTGKNDGVVELGFRNLRRSPRFSSAKQTTPVSENKSSECIVKAKVDVDLKGRNFRVKEKVRGRGYLGVRDNARGEKDRVVNKVKVDVDSQRRNSRVKEKVRERGYLGVPDNADEGGEKDNDFNEENDIVESKRMDRDANKENDGVGSKRKRMENEEGDGVLPRWTKDQELALQRAYLSVNPTPHFWKKVSKMVPGKSAKDCFDKFHSNHPTPPQPQPRSRAKVKSFPLVSEFSLSASKLLKPTEPKARRPKRSHLGQKTLRNLVKMHFNLDQDSEVDMFSVLEPAANQFSQAPKERMMVSTPECKLGQRMVLQICDSRSSSGHKKHLLRFNSSFGAAVVSPPVLKPIRNIQLHEKYVDLLHCREAKRRAASKVERLNSRKVNSRDCPISNTNMVKAAKNALVSEARDAISQFQHLQANVINSSSDLDDDGSGFDRRFGIAHIKFSSKESKLQLLGRSSLTPRG
ncbi:hypothetical protein RJ641_011526 [Dillenia turbinata]|uniref:Myb-like domain-containing protein n=1 Tax=Dillenia turbinata TaxID=194707 RepID=A0AAN8Z3F8_9MAGN